MKLTVEEFKNSILPGLRAQYRDRAALEKAIKVFIDSSELQDASGNPVLIETISLDTTPSSGAEEEESEGGAMAGAGTTGTSAGGAPGRRDLTDLETKIRGIVKELATDRQKEEPPRQPASVTIPATSRKYSSLKHFKDEKDAYSFGMWLMGTMDGSVASERARAWCKDHGVSHTKALSEGVNTAGGFVVPPEFESTLIDLRERYGVFRRNCAVVPMMSDIKSIPRRTGGLTAYFVNEGGSITESDKTWDQVNLVAKKVATLTRFSSELGEDAAISIGDDLAGEIAWSFAQKEDQCGFIGDGSATYGGMVGASPKLKGLTSGTTYANIAGLRLAAVTGGWTAVSLTDFSVVMGLLPAYAAVPGQVKWYCSQPFFGSVMQNLASAAGGNTISDISRGILTPMFLGYPVEITQVMPNSTVTSDVCCLFGNLAQAAKMGDRRQTTIKLDESRYLEYDQVAVRGTERFDIVVHDVGNASATVASRVPGPIVGLITAAT